MRMFRGRFRDSNSEANLLTDAMELRSSSSTSILATGILATMDSLTASPAATLRTGMTTCTPRSARTRAVSSPIPLDAPAQAARRLISSGAHHMSLLCRKWQSRDPWQARGWSERLGILNSSGQPGLAVVPTPARPEVIVIVANSERHGMEWQWACTASRPGR